jgi:hypothetical protein
MRILFPLLAAAALLFACKPGSGPSGGHRSGGSSDTTALEQQVMAIHDAAMPRLAEITDLLAQLRQIRETSPEDPEAGMKRIPEGLEQVFEALKLADQGMWDWMKAYGEGRAATPPSGRAEIYTNELPKVTKMKDDIDKAIAAAEAWLTANAPAK